MTSQHIQPRSLCEAVADRIRDRILDHTIKPGEADMAADYGVSRTPVREALRMLQQEGLLTAHARRGMFVTVLDTSERAEAVELHHLLITYARQQRIGSETSSSSTLLVRHLKLAERHLQLAFGPTFREQVPHLQGASSELSSWP